MQSVSASYRDVATRLFSAFLINSLYAGHTNHEHLKIKLQIHGDIGFQNSEKLLQAINSMGSLQTGTLAVNEIGRINRLRAI